MSHLGIVCAAVVLASSLSFQPASAQPCEAAWGEAFLGFRDPGDITAAVMYDDGSGPALYIGGALEGGVVGRVQDGRVEMLPGLIGGMFGEPSSVNALCVHDDGSGPALYAAGRFQVTPGGEHRGVARWRNNAWEFVGLPINTAYAFAEFDEDGDGPAPPRLFVGGFRDLGARDALERWDGASWTSIGADIAPGFFVFSLAVIDDGAGEALYVGGEFPSAAGMTANSVARWNGAAWSVLGDGLPRPDGQVHYARVTELAWHDDGDGGALYAGGFFTANIDGALVRNLARWRDGAWTGPAFFPQFWPVQGMASVGDDLLLAGSFYLHGGGIPSVVARLRNGALEPLPGEPTDWALPENASGEGLIPWEDGALIFGEFDRVNDDEIAVELATWDGEAMAPYLLQRGLNQFSTGSALAVDPQSGSLAVGGFFAAAGAFPRRNVALFDGQQWSSLGEGLDGGVIALAMHDDGGGSRLYAGGAFTSSAGADLANSVAVFDGKAWRRFAALNTGEALSLASIGGDLYVGGNFNAIEGVAAPRIARWDGEAWSALGAGLSGGAAQVLTMIPWAGGMAVGGSFTNSAGMTMRHVAFWDGAQWTPIGEGLNFTVRALAEYAGDLYAAGDFTQTGAGAPARYVARWDGASWRPLPGSLSAPAQALRVYDDGTGPALFVAGSFGRIGLEVFGSIARWDGAVWSKLGTGLNGPVRALAVQEIDGRPSLVATGAFTEAAGVPSFGLAEWRGCLSSCPGDVDGDRQISMIDLMRVVDAFNTAAGDAAYDPDADFDNDGAVNFEDLNRVLAAYNMGC